MAGVLIGFAIIGFVIAVGYLIGRMHLLGDSPRYVLSRLVFFVLQPALLFSVLAKADVRVLFSSVLLVSLIAAVVAAGIYIAVMLLLGRRGFARLTVGTMAAFYVNANNIGLPVAVYVLGGAAFVAPVLLLQLLVFTPVMLTVLDLSTTGSVSLRRVLLQPVRNPLIVASVVGVLLSVFQVRLPDAVMEPFSLIGAAAVPVVLISFGMSLHGQRPLQPGAQRLDVLLASAIKVIAMPVVAYLLGAFVFSLTPEHLFVVVVLAALPSAQNVFNYAQRYETGEVLARDAVLLTTIVAVPVLVAVAALLQR